MQNVCMCFEIQHSFLTNWYRNEFFAMAFYPS